MKRNEKNLSALEPQESPEIRFPRQNVHPRRPSGDQTPSSEGPRPSDRLMNSGNHAVRSLCKADKLRFKSEFDQVRQDGVKYAGRFLLAVVAPAPDGLLRCGVVCGKKYSLLAVKRNRARRLLWESFRLLKADLGICRLILIPRRRIADVKRQEVTRELAQLLAKAGKLPDHIAASPPES
jgi:ribonuclease P protein component